MPLIFRLSPLVASVLLALPLAHAEAPSHPLNDTGIVWSGHATSGNAEDCAAGHPAGQDCHYGRDAIAGTLTKTGASASNNGIENGFDFTKIGNNGSELDIEAVLGSGDEEWACTKDNVTGLVWEVKVDDEDHLRHKDHTYIWSENPESWDGDQLSCNETLEMNCTTAGYRHAVNEAELCGFDDWRMPTIKELEGIVDFGRDSVTDELPLESRPSLRLARDLEPEPGLAHGMIDPDFFPNTPAAVFWSGTPYANTTESNAWNVDFLNGEVNPDRAHETTNRVRLVRGPSPTPE
jgi:hypothetical protein